MKTDVKPVELLAVVVSKACGRPVKPLTLHPAFNPEISMATKTTPLSPAWSMLKDTLNKYQWRQMRRKKDPFLVFDTHVPFSETQIQLLKNKGFGIHHTGVPGHLGMVTIIPPTTV